jgi:hypothetical protein
LIFTTFPKVESVLVDEREFPAQFPTLHHFPPFYTTLAHFFPYLSPSIPTIFPKNFGKKKPREPYGFRGG